VSSYTLNFLIGNTLEPKCLNLNFGDLKPGPRWNNDWPHALEVQFHPGLSYQASGGLLAGEPGGHAGGPIHYALYEPGRVL
jgi:hypothetical protein